MYTLFASVRICPPPPPSQSSYYNYCVNGIGYFITTIWLNQSSWFEWVNCNYYLIASYVVWNLHYKRNAASPCYLQGPRLWNLIDVLAYRLHSDIRDDGCTGDSFSPKLITVVQRSRSRCKTCYGGIRLCSGVLTIPPSTVWALTRYRDKSHKWFEFVSRIGRGRDQCLVGSVVASSWSF